ncbi:hypothetical protein ROHU_003641 [Labeo rohita]|uniref:Uncharacterized protein n=1 Tax=Labeo rohita TaxID=84645 RepID=A0A498NW44_LABRO|nr:hypothetical protein ROHU_003641 [Labeo rohita]
MALLRGLIVLCLLHMCVQSIQSDVSPAALAEMIQYFDDNVQPKADAQYALAILVPQDQCTNEEAVIENVFSKEDAKNVKDVITKGEKCVLCTTSGNVIAMRPNGTTKEHAEHILLYPLGFCRTTEDPPDLPASFFYLCIRSDCEPKNSHEYYKQL